MVGAGHSGRPRVNPDNDCPFRLPGSELCPPSPSHADGRLYFCNQEGKTTVLKPGRTGEVLATNPLDTGLMASPAAAGPALFLRTKTHLYRIEDPRPVPFS